MENITEFIGINYFDSCFKLLNMSETIDKILTVNLINIVYELNDFFTMKKNNILFPVIFEYFLTNHRNKFLMILMNEPKQHCFFSRTPGF